MPLVSRILPDGSVEEFFYEDPPAAPVDHVNQEHPTKHESVDVDGGVIKLDGDLDTPLVITKDLQSEDKYITCKTVADAEQFTVSGVGEVRCQDVGCTDIEVTDGLHVGNQFTVGTGTALINATGMHVYKDIQMSVKPGTADPPPNIYTSGSVVAVKDGMLAFVPYDEQGNQIPGHVYRFGRQENIGDLTHDNDGMNMRKLSTDQEGIVRAHRIHICPDATDPNILVCSKKDASGFNTGDYIRFQNVGPQEAPTEDNVVFRVDNQGDIKSSQIDTIDDYLMDQQDKIFGVEYDLTQQIDHLKAEDTMILGKLNGNEADIDSLVLDVTAGKQDILDLEAAQLVIEGNITTHTNAIASMSSDITVLQNSAGGGVETLDLTTHDSKDIGLGGDYDSDNWGNHNDIRTVDWGTNPTSLTILVRAAGYMYLPDPNQTNLTLGNVVTVVFAPKHSHNCTLNVAVHDDMYAWISKHNDQTPDTVYGLVESRVARFIYLGLGFTVSGNFVDYSTRHRWLLETID